MPLFRAGINPKLPARRLGRANPEPAAAYRLDQALATVPDATFEIVCVNDGSRDRSAAILRQQFVVDPRVKGNITLYSETPLTPDWLPEVTRDRLTSSRPNSRSG